MKFLTIFWCVSAVIHMVLYLAAPADTKQNSMEQKLSQIKELIWMTFSVIMAVLVRK